MGKDHRWHCPQCDYVTIYNTDEYTTAAGWYWDTVLQMNEHKATGCKPQETPTP